MKETRLFDILSRYLEKFPNQKVALAGKPNDVWVKYSIQEYIEKTNDVSYALIKLGIKAGDKVAIIGSNKPEWNMLDMGIMQIGAITVPIYPTITEKDYLYILNHCEAKLAVIEGTEVMNKIINIMPDTPNLQYVYTFINRDKFPYLEQLFDLGKENRVPEILEKCKAVVKTTDCATIIYTSGTTGQPKGVMLSHSNILNQIDNLKQTPDPKSNIAFSFLPLSHAYERMLVFLYQYLGMSVYYAKNLGTIADNLKEINPTMMSTVPRMLEKIYDKILNSGKKLKGANRWIFFWAVNVAKKYKIEEEDRSWCYSIKHNIADKLVYSTLRKNIGGNFDIVVSGAASIQAHLASFFSAIGMPVFEGYGLTETSPVIAVSSREKYGREVGTVGFPLPGVEVKITDAGEVVCRGHNVMLGYYKDEAMTQQVIDKDGWFHTGDMGKFTDRGQLMLTGRIKNIFKTSLGKYVNPELIETKFSESRFIDSIIVVGENQKFVGALIVPDFAFIKNWCTLHDVEYTTPAEMIKNKYIIRRYAKEIEKYNTLFSDTEKIKKFALIADEWTIQNGILTPTLKVKRNVVQERYKSDIDKLFT
ncbi:MAG: long-chain fatty acid--CoA ligase [Bacteroidales bacterium]|jgi:long-chain acyl-CoA synthetase|nr:long-chain fatty acid--CoA ligase [Bacteroidales bacterium]MDD2204695.1 long-chain fatty acid--CoA ligase [Bacteroidales bacterium]MDD3152156.1 long-chain fatty acid--CoA ligase [Bacteroidales bacterium]MDD3914076.1 long-chain fatty acid--CoA ligase [Bacteroidales bacterium]MDD4634022.1 long-chain fatty acid--CoA ligase [Bacteroidales bacterium]